MSIGTNLLLNLLIILITMIIHQFWIESKPGCSFAQKYAILFTSGMAIVLVMTFSIYEYAGIQYDLRRVPLWFGTIYGGPGIGFVLLIETILIRSFQGGFGLTGQIAITSVLYIVIIGVRPFYFRLKAMTRMFVAAGINLFFSLVVLLHGSAINQQWIEKDIWIQFVSINVLGIILVNISLEAIRKNHLMRMKLFHSSKLDAVSHLAAAVNDQVKNPLTTVRGMIQMVTDEPSMPTEKKKLFLQTALDEVDKIDQIVTDYLTFARPYPDRREKLEIETVINESLSVVKPLADVSKVDITCLKAENCYILGDQQKFVQALVNILTNSIDALPNGGSILIQTVVKDDKCHIHITDNGKGMSSSTLDRLGEPYFNMAGSGSGLGMMVVFKIIEAMKGNINIHSEIGVGTEVELALPVVSSID
ncbi:MAG TPA: ATP-binding protein [Bacillaceae bacterium]